MAFIDKTQFIENFQYFDKEIVFEIIEIFINEYPERINSISESVAALDFDNIKFNAHSIKGVIANFVAPDIEQQARELEMMGANKTSDGINDLFDNFKVSTAQLVDELKEIKENYK